PWTKPNEMPSGGGMKEGENEGQEAV
ncbi:hypothetical protein LCGC14_1929950, partial [marine sediment metagenome]